MPLYLATIDSLSPDLPSSWAPDSVLAVALAERHGFFCLRPIESSTVPSSGAPSLVKAIRSGSSSESRIRTGAIKRSCVGCLPYADGEHFTNRVAQIIATVFWQDGLYVAGSTALCSNVTSPSSPVRFNRQIQRAGGRVAKIGRSANDRSSPLSDLSPLTRRRQAKTGL